MNRTALALAASAALATPAFAIDLQFVGRYSTGQYDQSAAEITAYDATTRRMFVVNNQAKTVDIVSIANPAAPAFISQISLGAFAPNSVSVKNGVVAIAAENRDPVTGAHNPGKVFFYNAASAAPLGDATVGALPDMVTFTPDGTRVVVANEGEPNSYNQPDSFDPEGSVSVIGVSFPSAGSISINTNQTAAFTSFNGQEAALRAQGVRIYGPGATAAQDFEPEYVSISADGARAFVTLQENNALATVDLATATVVSVKPLGFKDHSLAPNKLDASDRDNAAGTGGTISIRNQPIFGMYQPDAIAGFTVGGQNYLITANEGDARAYTGFNEEALVSTLSLDSTVFPNGATLKGNGPNGIGRLQVTNALGDTDNDGDFDRLYALGGRSFSILREDGSMVFDSGDAIEQFIAGVFPSNFNANNTNNNLDARSARKGPEPEAVTIGEAFGRTLAFVGLERVGGVLVYDLADPSNPTLLDYLNTRNFAVTPSQANLAAVGDLGPEGLLFIPAADSPTGLPLLLVSNEISGTTAIYTIVPEPTALGAIAVAGMMALRRRR